MKILFFDTCCERWKYNTKDCTGRRKQQSSFAQFFDYCNGNISQKSFRNCMKTIVSNSVNIFRKLPIKFLFILNCTYVHLGDSGGTVVKVLCCKSVIEIFH